MYGTFVRSVRTSRGLTQLERAEIAGISQPNLSAIENDRRMPTVDSLNRIVVACGYELAAVAGPNAIYAPLPKVGWFPDEDRPPRLDDDPPDEAPTVTRDTPMTERVRVINAVLGASAP
jgi:transcriptional regulator with XRE-family HTH domain